VPVASATPVACRGVKAPSRDVARTSAQYSSPGVANVSWVPDAQATQQRFSLPKQPFLDTTNHLEGSIKTNPFPFHSLTQRNNTDLISCSPDPLPKPLSKNRTNICNPGRGVVLFQIFALWGFGDKFSCDGLHSYFFSACIPLISRNRLSGAAPTRAARRH